MNRGRHGIRRGTRDHGNLLRAALVSGAVAAAPSAAAGPGLTAPGESCPLCSGDLDLPIIRLDGGALESIAAGHAAFNERQIARIDSLLRSGVWGPPDDPQAMRRAHLLARLTLVNAYRDLVRWAASTDLIYETDGAALTAVAARYSDASLFLGPRLQRLRIGLGRACARYAVDEPGEGEARHGGRLVEWKIRDMRIQGTERRVIEMKLPTGQDGEVRFLFAAHHTMSISHERASGPPSFEWFLAHDIEGAWVRKWGTHRPTAYMHWRSGPETAGLPGPAPEMITLSGFTPPAPRRDTALVGVRLYVPGLRLRLPILPDIDIDDLREADVILPVLEVDYLRGDRTPAWLEVHDGLGFVDWNGHGEVPVEIRARFPDL